MLLIIEEISTQFKRITSLYPARKYGQKMIHAITMAKMHAIVTAPAAMSLMILISGRMSVVTKSHIFSSALLIVSKLNTKPETISTIHHSVSEILK